MTTKVHRIVLYVVDHDALGSAEVANVLETARYPNRCIRPEVVETSTREIEWRDDHPINMTGQSHRALEELFKS